MLEKTVTFLFSPWTLTLQHFLYVNNEFTYVQQRSVGNMEFRGVLKDFFKYCIIFLNLVMFMVASAFYICEFIFNLSNY